jgi:hypothetical protein
MTEKCTPRGQPPNQPADRAAARTAARTADHYKRAGSPAARTARARSDRHICLVRRLRLNFRTNGL